MSRPHDIEVVIRFKGREQTWSGALVEMTQGTDPIQRIPQNGWAAWTLGPAHLSIELEEGWTLKSVTPDPS